SIWPAVTELFWPEKTKGSHQAALEQVLNRHPGQFRFGTGWRLRARWATAVLPFLAAVPWCQHPSRRSDSLSLKRSVPVSLLLPAVRAGVHPVRHPFPVILDGVHITNASFTNV